MNSWLWAGDKFAPGAELPVTDRAVRYGMSIFETLRVHRGRALFLHEHFSRLEHAAAAREFIAGLPLPETVAALAHGLPDGVLRIYVTAGDGSPFAPCEGGRVFALHESRAPLPAQEYERGYRAVLHPEAHLPTFGGAKTGNYWSHVAALARAQKLGSDEALLFNPEGELVSSTLANVFLVRAGELITPALPCGARDGVLREWVLARERVQETSIFVGDVEAAEEVFLTNSWIGIMPVRVLGQRSLPRSPFAERLQAQLAKQFDLL